MLINAANDGAKAMKSKREKQLIALEDSQGCLEFWTKFGASLESDRYYEMSNGDFFRLANGETTKQLCACKIAHHQAMIANLKAKIS